jgi:UDP-glucose 4-epimerase
LGSVNDDRLLDSVFSSSRPQTVFHAAAFKHVGLLERNPFAAISNNAIGGYTLSKADCAMASRNWYSFPPIRRFNHTASWASPNASPNCSRSH